MVWLGGLLPFEQAAQVFARIGRCLIPKASIQRQIELYGPHSALLSSAFRNYAEHIASIGLCANC